MEGQPAGEILFKASPAIRRNEQTGHSRHQGSYHLLRVGFVFIVFFWGITASMTGARSSMSTPLVGSIFITSYGEPNAIGETIRDLDWVKESTYNSSAYDICTDGQYVYLLLAFDTEWYEEGPVLNCTNVTCYSPDGNVRWSSSLHNETSGFYGNCIEFGDNAIYVSGVEEECSNYIHHPVISKLYLNGTINWVKTMDQAQSLQGLSVDDSGIYFASSEDMGANPRLTKLNHEGGVIWNETVSDMIYAQALYDNVVYGASWETGQVTIAQWYTNGTLIPDSLSWTGDFGIPTNGFYACGTGIFVCQTYNGIVLKFDHQLNLVWNKTFPAHIYSVRDYGDKLVLAGNTLGALEDRRVFIAVLGPDGDMIDNYTWASQYASFGELCCELNGDLYVCGNCYADVIGYGFHAILLKCKPDRYPMIVAPPTLTYTKNDPMAEPVTFTISDDYTTFLQTLYFVDGTTYGIMPWWTSYQNGTALDFTESIANREDGTYNCTLLVDDFKFITQATIMVTVVSTRFPAEWVILGVAGAGVAVLMLALRIKHRKGGTKVR